MNEDHYAVVGNPIEHSMSPLIHAAFAKQAGQQLTYEKLLAPIGGFEHVVDKFFNEGGSGLNITAPFKNDAFRWVGDLDDSANTPQAVNTIAKTKDEFVGYNTDGVGLINDLKRLGWHLSDQRILILGAGGATQGILEHLLSANASVSVANRTLAKAVNLQTQFPDINALELSKVTSAWDIVVNATSSQAFESDLKLDNRVFSGTRCYDLNYSQYGITPFTEYVRSEADAVSDGLGMLVEQAAVAFAIWRGVEPSTTWVLEGLRNPKRQFIAGARCSKCSCIDTVYVELDLLGNATVRGCVECGFVEHADGTHAVGVQ